MKSKTYPTRASLPVLFILSAMSIMSGCNVPERTDGGANNQPKMAPEMVLEQVDGSGAVSLSEQRGKVVLVDLWATWCAPCIAELPHLQTLSEKFSEDDFMMLGVVLDSGAQEDILDFLREKEVRYTQVMGVNGTKESFGPFLGYPTKYLVNRNGEVIKRYFSVDVSILDEEVSQLIETGELNGTDETGPV